MVVTIRSAADAEIALRSHRPLATLSAVVSVPQAVPEQAARWQRGLNLAFRECGCTLGSLLTVLALVVSLGLQFAHIAPVSVLFLLGRTLVAMLLAGGLGKVLGLILARIRIARIIQEMRRAEGELA